MRVILVLAGCLLLVGCNALVGVPENMDEQPWRTVYLIAFFVVCLVPVITLITLFAVRLSKPTFIRQRKPLFVFSAGMFMLMLCAWLGMEFSLPKNTNIRLDLFIVIPASAVQMVLIALSGYFYGRSRKGAA